MCLCKWFVLFFFLQLLQKRIYNHKSNRLLSWLQPLAGNKKAVISLLSSSLFVPVLPPRCHSPPVPLQREPLRVEKGHLHSAQHHCGQAVDRPGLCQSFSPQWSHSVTAPNPQSRQSSSDLTESSLDVFPSHVAVVCDNRRVERVKTGVKAKPGTWIKSLRSRGVYL